jgi:hypothetical protein
VRGLVGVDEEVEGADLHARHGVDDGVGAGGVVDDAVAVVVEAPSQIM